MKLIRKSFLGFLMVILFNLTGSITGIYIGVNIVTSVTAGVLGLPGLIMMIFMKSIII